ncbi:YolD-like family protein, partial [Bacillus thuringiensis]|nr:YolD-like family protein [Bacillus thuringiensis]
LLCSLLSEEEILITYYEDGHLLSSYMTVVGIDQQNRTVICTDAFSNVIEVKLYNLKSRILKGNGFSVFYYRE